MKATKMTLIAALAVGSLLTLSPALRADDATNTPPAAPPMGGPPPAGMHRHGMRGPDFDRLAERLNLTDKQKPKVQAIFDKQHQQMRSLWQNQSLSREDRMAKMRTIREETVKELRAELTVDQFKKLQEMLPLMGGPRNGMPPGGGPGRRGQMFFNRLAEQLNLTDKQKPKVQTILEEQFQQMRPLWRDPYMAHEDLMAKMKTIHEDTLAKLKDVLTVDQFKKFQEMRPMMGGPHHGPPWGRPPGSSSTNNSGTNAPASPPPQS